MDFITALQTLLATQIADTFAWIAKLLMPLLVLLGLSSGCVVRLEDNGSAGVRFSQGIEFYSNAAGTGQESMASIDGKPLVEHILDLKGADGSDPETSPIE